jgi:hypothetical protein
VRKLDGVRQIDSPFVRAGYSVESRGMQGLINDGTLAIALAFIVPGYIIGTIRAQFLAGRRPQKIEQQVLEGWRVVWSISVFGILC